MRHIGHPIQQAADINSWNSRGNFKNSLVFSVSRGRPWAAPETGVNKTPTHAIANNNLQNILLSVAGHLVFANFKS